MKTEIITFIIYFIIYGIFLYYNQILRNKYKKELIKNLNLSSKLFEKSMKILDLEIEHSKLKRELNELKNKQNKTPK